MMRSARTFRDELDSLVDVIDIYPRLSQFGWFGEASGTLTRKWRQALPDDVMVEWLTHDIADTLYRAWYVMGIPTPVKWQSPARLIDKEFVATLPRYGEPEGPKPFQLSPSSGARLVRANRSGSHQIGASPLVGFDARPIPQWKYNISPGYALIDTRNEPHPSRSVIRLYWNISSDGAKELAYSAFNALGARRLPFSLKVLSNPLVYDRSDAAVVYVGNDNWPLLMEAVDEMHRDVREWLGSRTPAMTFRCAPGIGLAENPPSHSSFGQYRCRQLAQALIRVGERHKLTSGLIADELASSGFDVDKTYRFATWKIAEEPKFLPNLPRAVSGLASAERLKESARDIAIHLGRRAIMADGFANWVTWAPSDILKSHDSRLVMRSLGHDVYSGYPGICLFLAEASKLPGADSCVRDAAIGALRLGVLQLTNDTGSGMTGGFYSGKPGTAAVLALAASMLEVHNFGLTVARSLSEEIERTDDVFTVDRFDVMDGGAGGILSLMALNRSGFVTDTDLVERAARRYLRHVREKWLVDARGVRTGFAHGLAGIATAVAECARLAELREEATAIADELIVREDQEYSPFQGAWRDTRWDRRGRCPRIYPEFWCNGAAGVLMSRLRMVDLGVTEIAGISQFQLSTATSALNRFMDHGASYDLSLCHGLLGNVSLALSARRSGMASSEFSSLLDNVLVGISEQVPGYLATHSHRPAGLMLGLAGLGHFLLAAADDIVPFALVPSA